MTIQEYCTAHSTLPCEGLYNAACPAENFDSHTLAALKWLERETHLRTNHARMLSGLEVGALLASISKQVKPRNILEIGVFTGYSTICLSRGLTEGGTIDALEINDELEDLILEGERKAGIDGQVRLHIGDAMEIIPTLKTTYDLIYIDANKREYPGYWKMVREMVRPGGIIIADNVLWSGKVVEPGQCRDAQARGILAFNDTVFADPCFDNCILPIRDGLNIAFRK